MKKVAVYAGSFDPFTYGHLWVIERALKIFDKLIIAIARNSDKNRLFTPEEIEDCIEMGIPQELLDSKRIEISVINNEFIAYYAYSVGAEFFIRGVRSSNDLEYEKVINSVNHNINPNLLHVYLIPPEDLSYVSSSMVKSLFYGSSSNWENQVRKYVPPFVCKKMLHKSGIFSDECFCEVWVNDLTELSNGFIGKDPDLILTKTFKNLRENYNGREYHNFDHIKRSILLSDEINGISQHDLSLLRLSLFFHDCVCDPTRDDNEKCSTEVSSMILGEIAGISNLSYKTVTQINELIMATKYERNFFNNCPSKSDGENIPYLKQLIREIDFSILSSPSNEYDSYRLGIFNEYTKVISEDIFLKGRLDFVNQLLAIDRIFNYLPDSRIMNPIAKRNLRREKKQIEARLKSK